MEEEKLLLTGRNLVESNDQNASYDIWSLEFLFEDQQTASPVRPMFPGTVLHQSSEDISAGQSFVVPSVVSPTERRLFISLIWCPPQSSRGQSDSSEHRELTFGGQPPPQIPFKFIHLCTSVSASRMASSTQKRPSIRRFLSTTLSKKWCIYERHCGVFYDTDGMTWLFMWCGISSCVITESDLTIAAPFSVYLDHLSGIENCRTQKSGMLWDGFSQASKRLLSLLKTEISCVKTGDAVLFQVFSLIGFGIDGFAFRSFFMASPCRWESGESGNAVIKFSFCLQGENGATLTSAGRSVLSRGGTALHVGSQQGAEGNN